MIIKSNLRPTTMKTNSRYRGQTELEKYTNFVLESVHDLKLLSSVMDRNEFLDGHRGQTDFIHDNFVAYVGGGTPITAGIETASRLSHPQQDVFTSPYLTQDARWAAYGGCAKTNTPTGLKLESNGLSDPAGIGMQLQAEAGDVIYIRMAVRILSGDGSAFTVGSRNINQNEGDLERFEIPQNGSIIYIDKRLYCKHREPITISIDVHNLPDVLGPVSVEISNLEIKYMSENVLTVEPINTVIKSKVNNLESSIKNIINNI